MEGAMTARRTVWALLGAYLAALALAAERASAAMPASRIAFWMRVAQCETGSRWGGLGSTYQGGLGIWWGNWDRWARALGLPYADAGQAPPLVQIRAADWAYRNESPRPYWGCFSTVGRPA